MTERDSLILDFISKYKLCTSEHIYKVYFNQVHRTVCNRRLKYLAEYGYVERFKYNGNNNVYYIGKKISNKLIKHDLLITDFVVKLIEDGYEILDFKKSFCLGDIISDAYLKISKDKSEKNILLEVQLSGHDCLSKYKNFKKVVIENTHWDVMPRLVIVGNVEPIELNGMKVSYLNLNLEGELL